MSSWPSGFCLRRLSKCGDPVGRGGDRALMRADIVPAIYFGNWRRDGFDEQRYTDRLEEGTEY